MQGMGGSFIELTRLEWQYSQDVLQDSSDKKLSFLNIM